MDAAVLRALAPCQRTPMQVDYLEAVSLREALEGVGGNIGLLQRYQRSGAYCERALSAAGDCPECPAGAQLQPPLLPLLQLCSAGHALCPLHAARALRRGLTSGTAPLCPTGNCMRGFVLEGTLAALLRIPSSLGKGCARTAASAAAGEEALSIAEHKGWAAKREDAAAHAFMRGGWDFLLVTCASPACATVRSLPRAHLQPRFQPTLCSACGELFCAACEVPWHLPVAEGGHWQEGGGTEAATCAQVRAHKDSSSSCSSKSAARIIPAADLTVAPAPELGRGSHFVVRVGRLCSSSSNSSNGGNAEYVAVKSLIRGVEALGSEAETLLACLAAEMSSMASLQSPYLIRFHGICKQGDGSFALVMGLAEGGTLGDFGRCFATGIPQRFLLPLLRDACTGLAALHAAGHSHNDIKPENILLQVLGDGGVRAVVADFGLVRALFEAKTVHFTGLEDGGGSGPLGTMGFIAPENFMEGYGAGGATGKGGSAGDMFSMGIALFMLATGARRLWPDTDKAFVWNSRLAQGKRPDVPDTVSPDLRQLIMGLWAHSAGSRLTAQQVVERVTELLGPGQGFGTRFGTRKEWTDKLSQARQVLSEKAEEP